MVNIQYCQFSKQTTETHSNDEYFHVSSTNEKQTIRRKTQDIQRLLLKKVLVIKLFQIVDFDTSHLNKNVTFLVNHYYNINLHNRP